MLLGPSTKGLTDSIAAMEASLADMVTQMGSAQSSIATMWAQRVKFATIIATAGTGIYTGALGAAGLFTAEPAVIITPKMNADNFDWRYALSGDPSGGYSITVTFTRRNNTVLGNLTTLLAGISLINTPVATTFSLAAMEQAA